MRVKPVKDNCIGCHLCEIACLTAHSRSKDVIIAWRNERAEGLTACKTVLHRGPDAVALSCQHCAEPKCVRACIAGALRKNPETGRVEYLEEQCVGCWSCVMACPFGSIGRREGEGKIYKCDLCQERGAPACVEVCPNEALILVSDDE